MAIKAFPLPEGSSTGPFYSSEDVALLLGLHTGSYWAIDCGVIAHMGGELNASVAGSVIRIDSGWAMLNGFFYYNDAVITLQPTLPTISTTSKRIVAQIVWDDPEPNDISVNVVVLEGTDGISAVPQLIQLPGALFQIPLWSFDMDTFGGITNLTDDRIFAQYTMALNRASSSDSNPHGLIGWAVVDVLAGEGPTVIASDGPVLVYESYVDTSASFLIAVAVNVTEPSDDMTWQAMIAPYSGVFHVDFYDSSSEAVPFTPPGTDWQRFNIRPTGSVSDGEDNTTSFSGDDCGRFIITWWGTQP